MVSSYSFCACCKGYVLTFEVSVYLCMSISFLGVGKTDGQNKTEVNCKLILLNYKTDLKAERTAKNTKFNAQYFGYPGLTFLRGYTEARFIF